MTKSRDTRQMEVLLFIYNEVQKKGYPPTVREIGNAVNLSSTSTVHGHLSRLEKSGYIYRDPTKPRAIEVSETGLTKLGVKSNQMPLLGTVTAGEPILAIEEATDFFPIPPDLQYVSEDLFMLKIRGDSMINVGILSDDSVIVRKQTSAENGDIVIAITDEDEATCKRFYKEKDYYRLQPENNSMSPIILENVQILGKVVGLYRSHIS
ncbi:transcriptional repressor LexA [Jeotgalibaca sp. MA1X17-3]|uniref:transcriptional repressor LexA n=1 Tax=Jeotgalibaca sp. MA1X17-3 TaxID=2908211 RepID=UPI001F1AD49D|nr:transcriptional repressor LexA [Jeotgalibaca sp. MA1X17-3]UJF14732.1 transcriptional repressor LexA [Jeotgalibaca sp. MA1X17-3]